MWKDDTMQAIKPKSRGAGLMISTIVAYDPSMPKSAQRLFEYGQNRDGHWNNDCFMQQTEVTIKVAEAKYPPRIFTHIWMFDLVWSHGLCF